LSGNPACNENEIPDTGQNARFQKAVFTFKPDVRSVAFKFKFTFTTCAASGKADECTLASRNSCRVEDFTSDKENRHEQLPF
jgi:hypothetical protein